MMVIGTLVTGFYVIEPGHSKRLSPVFSTWDAANHWLAIHASPPAPAGTA